MPERTQSIQNEDHPRPVTQEQVPWDIPSDFEGIMNYNPRHDIQDYLNLKAFEGRIDPAEFARLQIQLDTRTRRQIEKAIGERFSVEKSPVKYFIKNGRLMSPDYDRPVVEQYKIGQEFLTSQGSTETTREEAEVGGVAKAEQIFSDENHSLDLAVIIASPRGPHGSLYFDNCFDVYRQQEDETIIMTRYHSTLSLEKFFQAKQKLKPDIEKPDVLTDAFFLDNPIPTTEKKEEILQIFGIDSKTISYDQFLTIISMTREYIGDYLNTLKSIDLETFDSKKVGEVKISINAIFNASDRAKNILDYPPTFFIPQIQNSLREPVFSFGHPQILGRQEVRIVSGGCPGGQKGFSVSQTGFLTSLSLSLQSPSVLSFANYLSTNNEKIEDFQCPGKKKDGSKCTYVVRAYSGVKKCPECGMAATCA